MNELNKNLCFNLLEEFPENVFWTIGKIFCFDLLVQSSIEPLAKPLINLQTSAMFMTSKVDFLIWFSEFVETFDSNSVTRMHFKTAYDDVYDKSFFMKSSKSVSRFNLNPLTKKTKEPDLQLKFTLKESHKPVVIWRNLHLKVTAKITPFVDCTWSECWNSNLFSSQTAKAAMRLWSTNERLFRKKIKNTSRGNGERRRRQKVSDRIAVLVRETFLYQPKTLGPKMMVLHVRKNAFMRETIMINLYLTWLLLLSPWPSCFLLLFVLHPKE